MSVEHPINQEILGIDIYDDGTSYTVGSSGVTKIEATTKSGLNKNIPYFRVWIGDQAIAEFCQHSIVGVYFKPNNLT